MEQIVLAIDGGTTNTRVRVWRKDQLLGQASQRVGAKVVAETGSPAPWKQAIRETILKSIGNSGVNYEDVSYAVASGALTSDIGVYFIPHVVGAATIEKFAAHAKVVKDPEIADCPIVFCTGFRNDTDSTVPDNSPYVGFMRGEESETFGILATLGIQEEAVIVLPGSHTKFVHVGPGREILSCVSTMAGELIEAIAMHTTLSRSVEYPPYTEFHEEMALAGARLADKVGLPQVIFSTRALDLFGSQTPDERGSFLVGAVVSEDLLALRSLYKEPIAKGCPIFVGGSRPLRMAFSSILKSDPGLASQVVELPDEVVDLAPNIGAMAIARLALKEI